MGGLAGLLEEFREAIQDKGGDDPLIWTGFVPKWKPDSYRTQSYKSYQATYFPTVHIPCSTSELREEIAVCLAIMDLCDKQENAIKSFYDAHEPRSRSFEFWFEVAKDGISERRKAADKQLQYLRKECSIDVPVPNIDIPVRLRLLEYAIDHVIEDELKEEKANRTELINIIEDGTHYISVAEGIPYVRDASNSIWMNYLRQQDDLHIRNDHCCSRCGGELFVGIPYCMSCNTMIKR